MMRGSMRIGLFPALAVAALVALASGLPTGAASASVVIYGNNHGRECYMSAALKRDPKVSIDICTQALQEAQSRRDRAATFVNRGIIYAESRDFSQAIEDYNRALALEPNLGEAHVNLGMALLQLGGQDRAAVTSLTRGIDLGATKPELAYYARAVAYELLGDVRAAYEDYQSAHQLKPDWPAPEEQLRRFTIQTTKTARG